MQDGNEAAPRRFGLGKLFLFIIIVLIILGVALYSFFHINPLELIESGLDGIFQRTLQAVDESKQKTTEVLTLDPLKPGSYDVDGNSLVAASISDVRLIASDGQEKWYVPVSLNKPFVKCHQGSILVADLKGRYFSLIQNGRILWEKNLDEDIVNACFSQDFILIITESSETGYKRTIHVYSRDGQEVAYRSIADYYPFSVQYLPQYDKSQFITCGVETQGLEMTSVFEFLDLTMNQKGSVRGQDEIYAGALALSKGKVVLYGEKSIIGMDDKLSTMWRTNLNGEILTSINVLPDKWVIAALLDEETYNRERRYHSRVQILDINGKAIAGLTVDALVTDIEAKGNTVAFVAGSEVYFMNEKQEILDLYTAREKVSNVLLASDSLAYIVTSDKVVSVRVEVSEKFLGIF